MLSNVLSDSAELKTISDLDPCTLDVDLYSTPGRNHIERSFTRLNVDVQSNSKNMGTSPIETLNYDDLSYSPLDVNTSVVLPTGHHLN